MKLEELLDDQLYVFYFFQYDDVSKIIFWIDKFKMDYIMNEMKVIENDLYIDQMMIVGRNGLGDDLKIWERYLDENVKNKVWMLW